jgi:hypothetical protein
VVFDRLRAEEHRCCRLASRAAFRKQERDLKLLRCQLVERRRIAPACGLPGCAEFRACRLGPRCRTEAVERIDRRAQLFSCARSVSRTTQPRSVGESRSRSLVQVGRLFVERSRFIERSLECVIGRDQSACARGAGARPWLALREIASALEEELARELDYRPVDTGGAERAAMLIAELL